VITKDGIEHKMDVLICATGFDVSFRPKFPVVGKDGADTRDLFAEAPQTYLSVTTPKIPNYFSKWQGIFGVAFSDRSPFRVRLARMVMDRLSRQ